MPVSECVLAVSADARQFATAAFPVGATDAPPLLLIETLAPTTGAPCGPTPRERAAHVLAS